MKGGRNKGGANPFHGWSPEVNRLGSWQKRQTDEVLREENHKNPRAKHGRLPAGWFQKAVNLEAIFFYRDKGERIRKETEEIAPFSHTLPPLQKNE